MTEIKVPFPKIKVDPQNVLSLVDNPLLFHEVGAPILRRGDEYRSLKLDAKTKFQIEVGAEIQRIMDERGLTYEQAYIEAFRT